MHWSGRSAPLLLLPLLFFCQSFLLLCQPLLLAFLLLLEFLLELALLFLLGFLLTVFVREPMEFEAGFRDLHLLHLSGAGKREVTRQVYVAAIGFQRTLCDGTVAVDANVDVADGNLLVPHLCHLDADSTDRQLATFLLAHLCRPGLGDVDLEISLALGDTNIRQVEGLVHLQSL